MSALSSAPAFWSDARTINAPEHMTKSAALMLARRIEAYWRQRGHTVTCHIDVLQGERLDGHGSVHCVRSDMIGGMPLTTGGVVGCSIEDRAGR